VDKHFTKTQPLTEASLDEFLNLQKTKAESKHSWSINVSDLDENFDLSVKNPNKVEVVDERTPSEIADSIFDLNSENQDLINELREMLG
jgi:type I restriction enzyme M protein